MRRLSQCLIACLGLLAAPAPVSASLTSLTNLFVFGDSLSDAGNSGLRTQEFASVVFPPPPYFNGQFSNGPVAVQYLWNLYNPGAPPLAPSLAGGTNYAIGGATSGAANFNSVNPSVPEALRPAYDNRGAAWQLAQFAAVGPAFDPATSLFVVWFFPNDVFYALQTGGLPGNVPGASEGSNVVENGIANIAAIIQALALRGAEHFLVPNMPDLGMTPAFRDDPGAALLSGLTATFNTHLAATLAALDALLPIEIVLLDIAGILADIIAMPSAFGFSNVTEACVANLLNGRCDPNTWLFWDGVHPTTRAHELLAIQFAHAVPEPTTFILLAIALAGFAFSRRAHDRATRHRRGNAFLA